MWPSRGPKESQKDPITTRAKHVPRMDAIAAPALQGRGTGWSAQFPEWYERNRHNRKSKHHKGMQVTTCSIYVIREVHTRGAVGGAAHRMR